MTPDEARDAYAALSPEVQERISERLRRFADPPSPVELAQQKVEALTAQLEVARAEVGVAQAQEAASVDDVKRRQ
jgi:hypothetical protein